MDQLRRAQERSPSPSEGARHEQVIRQIQAQFEEKMKKNVEEIQRKQDEVKQLQKSVQDRDHQIN